jgi:phage shock protein E
MKRIIYKIQKRLTRSSEKNIDYIIMKEMLKTNRNIIIIDVRTEEEYQDNHIPGAINIPLQDIKEKIGRVVESKNEVIIVYCEYGGRSRKACNKLEKMGYVNVYNLDGGIEGIG